MTESTEEKRGPGRPPGRDWQLDATAEEVARAMFAAVEPPDPSRRTATGTGKIDARESATAE